MRKTPTIPFAAAVGCPLVRWQPSFVTVLWLEFPLLLWRRGLGRGGRLYRNLFVTILATGLHGFPRRTSRLAGLPQRSFDNFQIVLRNARCGFLHHLQKPIDFTRLGGIADIRSVPFRIDDHIPAGIEERRIWQAIRTAKFFEQSLSAWVLQVLILFVFLDDQLYWDEIFLEHRLNIWPIQEGIEFLAPTAPGSAKMKEDGLLFGGGLCLHRGKNLISG